MKWFWLPCCVCAHKYVENWILANALRGLFKFLLFLTLVFVVVLFCLFLIYFQTCEIRRFLAWQCFNYMQKKQTLFVLVIKMQIRKSLWSDEHWLWYDKYLKVHVNIIYIICRGWVTGMSDTINGTTTNYHSEYPFIFFFKSKIHMTKSLNKFIHKPKY